MYLDYRHVDVPMRLFLLLSSLYTFFYEEPYLKFEEILLHEILLIPCHGVRGSKAYFKFLHHHSLAFIIWNLFTLFSSPTHSRYICSFHLFEKKRRKFVIVICNSIMFYKLEEYVGAIRDNFIHWIAIWIIKNKEFKALPFPMLLHDWQLWM